MKTWSRIDLAGLLLALLGIASLFFSNSSWLTAISALMAAILLLHSVYNARFSVVRYRETLCHYQAVLSSAGNGWIAWNIEDEYVGTSKKLRTLFGIKQSTAIYMGDILSAVDQKDAEELSLNFNKLKKQGRNFTQSVKTLVDGRKIDIDGARMIVNDITTVLLWCTDITKSASMIGSLEQKLITTQQRLNQLSEVLDTLPMPVWCRARDLKITYCNKAYADHLGMGVEKVLLHNTPLVAGNLFGQGHSLAENAQKTHREQSISQFIKVGGNKKKVSMHECPVSLENFVGYASDTTEEEALAVSLERIITANREVLENLSTAIVIFGENTRVTFFNSAYQYLMKLESGWLHSKPTYGEVLDELRNNRQLTEQADYQAFKKAQLSMFTSLTVTTQELIHLPSGKTLRLMISPYPLGGLLFVYEDVSDSLALQRQNNTLLAVQRETINNLHEGIMVYGSDNRLKIINASMMKMWKLNELALDLKGKHISELLDWVKDELDYGHRWEEFRENAISNLTDRITKTGILTKKDGSSILFSYIPLPDGAHMHSFTDITDTCMVEKAIIDKNQALKAAQELRSEFVTGISIELKEPLNVLIGFTELLFHQYFGSLNERQLEYCQCVLSASHQLHKLVMDLQEMVSIDIDPPHLEISSFSIGEAIGEVIHSLEKRISEKNLSVVKNYSAMGMEFLGDKIRIKQAIYNILTNAIHRTTPNGRIDVIVLEDDHHLKIVIKDDGVGIYFEETKKVFRRTKNHSRNEENVGISMPFVRSLIELHGGTLSISSDVRGGTCIVCTLPISSKSNCGSVDTCANTGITLPAAVNFNS
ncbi:MAG: PAS-domain containing protein [Holosporaceae bacterium]|nr:PAS-domain containing protein [Holosporaceae bacterium]